MTINIERILATNKPKETTSVWLQKMERRSSSTRAIPVKRVMITKGIMDLIKPSTIYQSILYSLSRQELRYDAFCDIANIEAVSRRIAMRNCAGDQLALGHCHKAFQYEVKLYSCAVTSTLQFDDKMMK
jgi:hypothetical protein